MSQTSLGFVRNRPTESRLPPRRRVGAAGWLQANLFSSPGSGIATILSVLFLVWVMPPLLRWAFFDAVWIGEGRQACVADGAGACWAFIEAKFAQIIYGRYPIGERWRVDLGFLLLIVGLVPMAIPRIPFKRENALYLLIVLPVAAYVLLVGGVFGLEPVETALWGGLLVTLVVAIVGMVVSLPLGVVLALGRRSQLPIIRSLSIGFIEFWRGVPLITVLFMASVMLPLFLPAGTNFDQLLKALVGVALFSSAYMAETIRGGLQAIPRGQYEGAMALGLTYWQRMRLVILPQALRLVIPGIVNSFISLFKDTSLVAIIGIHDFLGIIQLNFSDPNWLSPATPVTAYVFAASVYWMFCFGMSRYSLLMEKRLNSGRR